MTAVVMEVASAEKHPNADSLRVYKMTAPDVGERQIIANLENVYDVGDAVNVVLSGSRLKDGTKIGDSKIRGVPSYGMALGPSSYDIGTDRTEEYCQEEMTVGGFKMIRWPSIESLYNVRRSMKITKTARPIQYIGKVKLDGTNAGIQITPDGKVAAQSRTKVITPDDDNMGFARWVDANYTRFSLLAAGQHMTIFGEWCGKGIQKGTAIAQLDRKVFVVFAIQYEYKDTGGQLIDINPISIEERLKPVLARDDIYVLRFEGDPITFNYEDVDVLKKQAEEINKTIGELEICDPWVKDVFGISGIGEGLVMYPLVPLSYLDDDYYPGRRDSMMISSLDYSELVFKAKGERHKVVKTKEAVQIDPEVAKSIADFVGLFVTEPRLEQILGQVELDIKQTGNFIKEFSLDVKKESEAELEASGLDWKQVAKELSTAARKWFMLKCNDLTQE